jgi:hypothetical protein
MFHQCSTRAAWAVVVVVSRRVVSPLMSDNFIVGGSRRGRGSGLVGYLIRKDRGRRRGKNDARGQGQREVFYIYTNHHDSYQISVGSEKRLNGRVVSASFHKRFLDLSE